VSAASILTVGSPSYYVALAGQVLEYIEESMPPETPLAFGLHPNAEIGFKLREAETFCNSLVQLQPRESGGELHNIHRHRLEQTEQALPPLQPICTSSCGSSFSQRLHGHTVNHFCNQHFQPRRGLHGSSIATSVLLPQQSLD